jgi:proteasome accessory factor C
VTRGRPPARDQVRRLLVLVPWIVQSGPVHVDDVAARFGITAAQVMKDLAVVTLVGLPPYTADELIDVQVSDDGWISAPLPPPVFRRPPRLTASEGFAVLAAGRALLAIPGADDQGALAGALTKLERELDLGGRVAVDLGTPPLLDVVRDATDGGVRLRIEYRSAWRDERTTRELEPHVVYAVAARWYVDGFDHLRGETRRFRVDRILVAEPTGDRFEPPRPDPPDRVFDPGPGARDVEVLVPPSGRWVVETYPVSYTDEPDGRLRVTFTVVGDRWLERVLLRLGPDAEVVSPDELRDTGRDAARRVLARYGR